MNLPRDLYTAAQVRELDRIAIQERGIPGYTLMQRAGEEAFRVLQACWPKAGSIAVVCGAGNNAGDGYVLARLAHAAGMTVKVLQLGDADQLKGDARTAYEAMLAVGLDTSEFKPNLLESADLIVDALLGTGLDREVTGHWHEAIDSINQLAIPVLSIDIPSGLNADSGQPMGIACRADQTVTFIGTKQGLLTGSAADYCGQIHFHDLSVPADIYTQIQPAVSLASYESVRDHFRPRQRTAHKGHFGHVLTVGGEYGYSGAVRMAAEAAARVGAGLNSVATRTDNARVINAVRPELMCHGVESAADLGQLLDLADVIAIGPGLGQSDWSLSLLGRVLDSNKPHVMDADALNLLARDPDTCENRVLTPHPGEAARMLDCTVQEIQADRFSASRNLQDKYGGVVVLKGSGSIITGRDSRQYVCAEGNPGMASGGMGDVLTGIIAGLVAQSFSLEDAAIAGVCLHAAAADQAAADSGERGLLASDLYPYLRRLINPQS